MRALPPPLPKPGFHACAWSPSKKKEMHRRRKPSFFSFIPLFAKIANLSMGKRAVSSFFSHAKTEKRVRRRACAQLPLAFYIGVVSSFPCALGCRHWPAVGRCFFVRKKQTMAPLYSKRKRMAFFARPTRACCTVSFFPVVDVHSLKWAILFFWGEGPQKNFAMFRDNNGEFFLG